MGSDLPPTPGVPLSDPQSLEQYFRSHFNELTTEAKAQLDDASPAAPRVVEGAFRHALGGTCSEFSRSRISRTFSTRRCGTASARKEPPRKPAPPRQSGRLEGGAGAHGAPATTSTNRGPTSLAPLHLVPDDRKHGGAQEVRGALAP